MLSPDPLTPGSGTGLLLRRTAERKSTFEGYLTLSVPVPCNRLLGGSSLLRLPISNDTLQARSFELGLRNIDSRVHESLRGRAALARAAEDL